MSTEPHRTTYSRAEALDAARDWMVQTYGWPRDLLECAQVMWHERMGLLVECLAELFPEEEGPADGRK